MNACMKVMMEGWAETCNIFRMRECCCGDVVDVGLKRKTVVSDDSKVADVGRRG